MSDDLKVQKDRQQIMIDNKNCHFGEMKNFRAALSAVHLYKQDRGPQSSVISKILIHEEYRHFFKKLSFLLFLK